MSAVKRRVAPPKALVEALLGCRKVAMLTHINPDGDGLGSQAALALALRSLGKTVVVANNDATPGQYSFLGLDAFAGDPAGSDLALSLDCPVLDRLGPRGKAAFTAALSGAVIDHHGLAQGAQGQGQGGLAAQSVPVRVDVGEHGHLAAAQQRLHQGLG
ncbi:MAG TPA: DHH family phosphoesterase, partial [bacterium]|nr:DHH family phosphoesterase [bacterium]